MAGIGFELRKIFKKDSIAAKLKGVVFATMTTIGPTVILLVVLLAINIALEFFGVQETEKMFFSSTCLYTFLIAIVVSGSTGTIISRVISDHIHDGKEECIPATILGSSMFVALLTSIPAIICCVLLYLDGKTNLLFLLSVYLLAIMTSIAYNSMTFVSALKEYSKITYAFLIGIVLGVICFFILKSNFELRIIDCMAIAMVTMFFTINVTIFYYVFSFFKFSNNNYFSFLPYFWKHPYLFLSGLFYTLGFYVSNVVYWFGSDISVQVSIFRVAPAYDMAMLLAIFANLTAPVIFVVKVETKFFEKYQTYVRSLTRVTYNAIEKNRRVMSRTIDTEIFYIYEIQMIITLIIACIGIFALPVFGFGGLVLNFFLVLSIGVFCSYLMYFTVVFLYYFDDQFGSFMTTFVFFLVTFLTSLVALELGIAFYPTGILVGGIASWIVGFLRLKYYVKNINTKLFCREG